MSGFEEACSCGNYIPGGGSRTNMKGQIIVQSDVPPDGEPWERRLCIDGLLRHELCHELYTSAQEHEKLVNHIESVRRDGTDPSIGRLHDIWNIVEDGRIETIELHEQPGSYEYIEAMNLLYPRIPYPEDDKIHTLESDGAWRVPPGYTALDAHGNVLDDIVVKTDPLTGEQQHYLQVPAGTELQTWGSAPVSLANQARNAILASSVPGFEPGELHPDVARVLELCRPHIQHGTAYGTDSAGSIADAMAIYQILKDNDMLLDAEEQAHGGDGPAGPMMNDDFGEGNPDGPKPGGQGGQGSEAQGGEGQGGGEGDEEGDGEGDGEEGSANGGGEEGEEGDGASSGDLPEGGRDAAEGSGYNPQAELPQTSEERERKRQELKDKMRDRAEKEIAEDQKSDSRTESRRRSKRDIRAEDFETPPGENVLSQDQLTNDLSAHNGEEAMAGERSSIQRLGKKLARELRAMRETFSKPKRYQLRGPRVDPKRLHGAVTGDWRIMETKRRSTKLDMEVSVLIDRSDSVISFGVDQTEDQFRMALMCGHASNETGVPIGIYGFSGSAGGMEHYAYKESRSSDLRGIDAIFKSGGGNTPTAEAVSFAAARMNASGGRDRVMVVVTDGAPSNQSGAIEQIRAARDQGIRVVGIGFMGQGLREDLMDEVFGSDNWHGIDRYEDAPSIVAGLIQDTLDKRLR